MERESTLIRRDDFKIIEKKSKIFFIDKKKCLTQLFQYGRVLSNDAQKHPS
jgi:hypothetical protein